MAKPNNYNKVYCKDAIDVEDIIWRKYMASLILSWVCVARIQRKYNSLTQTVLYKTVLLSLFTYLVIIFTFDLFIMRFKNKYPLNVQNLTTTTKTSEMITIWKYIHSDMLTSVICKSRDLSHHYLGGIRYLTRSFLKLCHTLYRYVFIHLWQ